MLRLSGLIAVGALTGCGPTAETPCTYNGRGYSLGDQFTAVDGCNSCSCGASGQIACTLIACDGNQTGYDAARPSPGTDGGGPMSSSDAGVLTVDGTGPKSGTDGATDAGLTPTGDTGAGGVSGTAGAGALTGGSTGGGTGTDGVGGGRGAGGARGTGDGGAPSGAGCFFADTYTYGPSGGRSLSQDTTTLSPTTPYRHERRVGASDPSPLSCAPALPMCGDATHLDAADILRDLADVDVQLALSNGTPPSYGRDTRLVDGQVFVLARADGHGFVVGQACTTTDAPCTPIPPGVQTLVNDLTALDTQQLADPACVALAAAR